MITEYQLHAFVDRQLGGREAGEVLDEASRSPELAARIATLQQLKALLQHAYTTPAAARPRRQANHAD